MRFLTAVFILFFTSISLAQLSEEKNHFDQLSTSDKNEIMQSWRSYFSGSPEGFFTQVYSKEKLPFESWIFGYESCLVGIDMIISELDQYDQNFRSNKPTKADQNYKNIIKIMQTKKSCAKAYWTAYMVKSVLLGPVLQTEKDSQSNGIGNDNRYELALLTLYLSNRGNINILDPQSRKDLANGDTSSDWLVQENGEYKITAYYSCLDSQIYLDDSLKPFNLATSLYHEIDHLYRDKLAHMIFHQDTNLLFDSSMITYIAMDELTATVSGGYYQRRMLFMESGSVEGDYNHTGNEFNFYDIQGPLNEATNYLLSLHQGKDYELGLSNPMSLLVALGLQSQQLDPKVTNYFCEMHQIILKGYFGSVVNECLSSMARIWRPGSSVGFILAKLYAGRDAWAPGLYPNMSQSLSVYRDQLNFGISYFTWWEKELSKPSVTCNRIVKAQEKGLLDSYIGTKLMKGGHNGNGGIRPILPCQRIHL